MALCLACDEVHKTKRAEERKVILNRLANLYKNTPFIKVAIVETRNGKLGIREEGDESITRSINPLAVIEYLFLVQGIAAR